MIFDKLFGKSEEDRGPDMEFIISNFRRKAKRLMATSDIEGLGKLFAEHAADATLQWPGYEERIFNSMEDELVNALHEPRSSIQRGVFDDI